MFDGCKVRVIGLELGLGVRVIGLVLGLGFRVRIRVIGLGLGLGLVSGPAVERCVGQHCLLPPLMTQHYLMI